jgi:hypothetical protein
VPFILNGAQATLSYETNPGHGVPQLVISGSAPGNSLEFYSDVAPLGAAAADQQGRATFLLNGLAPGFHTVFARERGTGVAVGQPLHVAVPRSATGRFSSPAAFALGIRPGVYATGDLYRDGATEFVAAGDGTVSVLNTSAAGTASPRIFPGVSNPTAILVADFDGDGWSDVAIASSSGQVAILLNTGNGGLAAPRTYNSGSQPAGIAIADFNGDGIPDLIVANEGGNDLSLLAGRSDGTFESAVHFVTGLSPRSVAAADLNGDGFPDLAVADFAGNEISILFGDGHGAFRNAGSVGTGNGPSLVLAGDFNEDGAVDLAALNQIDRTVEVLFGDGAGHFTAGLSLSNARSVISGHILGSEHLDLLIQSGSELRILAGSGDGTFSSGPVLQSPATPESLLLADLNGDGRLDVAAADMSGVLSVFTGSEAASLSAASAPLQSVVASTAMARVTTPSATRAHALSGGNTPTSTVLSSSSSASVLGQFVTFTATVNATDATGKVTFYDGAVIAAVRPVSAGQSAFSTNLLPSGVNSIKARYNGDSTYTSSISASVSQTVAVLPQIGFQTATTFTMAGLTAPQAVVTADFNGDGQADIAVTDSSGTGVAVFLGNGNGTFGAGVSYGSGTQPSGLVAVDLNGDGKMDLAFTSAGSATVTVLLGSGTGTFSTFASYSTGTTPQSVAAADFNGDGIADLVVTNSGSGTISVLLGNGDGSLQTALSPVAVGTTPASVAVADFDGDGNADVVTANTGSGNVSVLLGKGDGTFQPATAYPSGAQPISVAAVDLNGDGKFDLAVANGVNTGTVNVLLNKGDGTFATRVSYGAGTSPHYVTSGDFNADGIPDLIVINKGISLNTGTFSFLAGNGNGTFVAAQNTGLGSLPLSAAVADFNGDGRLDFVAASSGTHNLYLISGHGLYPNLTVASAHAASFVQGQTGAVYTLTVTNTGTVATSGIVSVVDALPPGLTATDVSGNGWTCVLATLTCTRPDTLSANLSYPDVTLTANVAANTGINVINSVVVSGGGELITNDDSGTDPTVVIQTTSLSLVSSVNPSFTGAGIALTATVSSTSATGTVIVYDGLTPIAAQAVFNGQAVLSTSLLSSGTHVLTAIYGGDFQYQASTSLSLTQTVQNQLQNGFQAGVNYALGVTNPSAVTVADFNGDGHADIAVANSSSTSKVTILLNQGDGTFQSAVNVAAGGTNSAPVAIVAADFNADGITDVAVADSGTNTVSVLLGNGNGTFRAALNSPAGSHPQHLVAGDFNRDGVVDLAVADYNSGTVSILIGNGNGTFQAPSGNAVGVNPRALVLGDFNGDGFADLAVANYGSNTISVLLGRGDGSFQAAVTYPVGTNPQALVRGDFDGDGVLDLAVANSGSNTVTVLSGNGDGTFRTVGAYSTGNSPDSLVAADFGGDGILDLAVGDANAGVSLLLGVGDGSFQSPLSYSAGTSPVSMASADFDGDGTSDLVVANQGSGNVTVLLGGLFYSDVTIAKSHAGNFTQGQTGAQYSLTVSNAGQYPTAGTVTASDVLPAGLTATAIAGQGWKCALLGLSCVRTDALAPAASYPPVTVAVTVAGGASYQVTNTAKVAGGHENNATNNTATDLTTVIQTTTLSLTNSPQPWIYGQAVTLTATVSPAAATGTVTFSQGPTTLGSVAVVDGAASIPAPALTPGAYAFSAIYSGDSVYTGSSDTLSPTVGKATATITLGNLAAMWDGTQKSVSVTTVPAGLSVTITYGGDTTAPSNAGSWPVVATVNDANYGGTATGSLVISPAAATVSLTAPPASYDGNPKIATATTTPPGLAVTITYSGTASAPVSAGTYQVAATVADPNYRGTATGTLVISPASVTITLTDMSATYDGTPKPAGAATSPAGVAVIVTYNGSSTAPTAPGSYSVSAVPASANYGGSASGTLTIARAPLTVTLSSLTASYDGTPKGVAATTSPVTKPVTVTYNGSSNAPTSAGSYAVVATVSDSNYSGSATGTLVIAKATPALTFAPPAPVIVNTVLGAAQLNASATVPGAFSYTPSSGTVLSTIGLQLLSATFTPADTTNYNSGTIYTTIAVNPPPPPAVVTGIAAITANGSYGAGASVSLALTFNRALIVSGAPTLALNSGGTAKYSSGSGTQSLVFTYTVAAGDTSPRLDAASTSALSLTGGSIIDIYATPVNPGLPVSPGVGSLAVSSNIAIDAIAPTVVSYQVLFGSQSYNVIGTNRNRLPWQISGIRVVFSKPVAQGSVASLTGVTATALSGLGTTTLTWAVNPLAMGNFATTLQGTGVNALADSDGNLLGGGTAFTQNLKILCGDVNDDGVVNASDMTLATTATHAPYNIIDDLNGDGAVTIADVGIVRGRVGTSLQ